MSEEFRDKVVRRTVELAAPIEMAYSLFTDGMTTWWPRQNTFSRGAFKSVTIEPKAGGRWYEQAADGREEDWGRVLVWEPPNRLVLTWQINAQGQPEPDSKKASVVEVRFVEAGQGLTRVKLEHREFHRHGPEAGEVWREGMESEDGWDNLLGKYSQAVR
jgi:uncharacterized protein YndB with AHSA1/START domain